jgi:hypothetical protein
MKCECVLHWLIKKCALSAPDADFADFAEIAESLGAHQSCLWLLGVVSGLTGPAHGPQADVEEPSS